MIEADIDAYIVRKIDAYIVRQVEAYLRDVAPTECPQWSAGLVVTYDELKIDKAVDSEDSRGVSAHGMDRFAAWFRQDDTLVGRPVFGLATGRVPPTLAGLVELRRTGLPLVAPRATQGGSSDVSLDDRPRSGMVACVCDARCPRRDDRVAAHAGRHD